MKKYPAYKKGIYDWWEQVPSTWQEVSMKEVAVLSDERCGERQEELLSVYRELGVIRKNSRNDNHNVESEDLSNYKMVYPGYLVMNKMKMWQGSLGISDYRGIVSPAYIVCKLNGNFDSKYLHTLLRATPFKTYYNRVSRGIRVGQWDMSFSDFRSLKIFLPNLQEQQQIVRYIDWKTSQINHLIHGYERLISLLEERKTAVINEAVTKGIRKGVKMKECPLQEIYSIPSHWKIIKAQRIFKEYNRLAETEDETVLSLSQKDGLIPFDDLKERTLQTSSYENWKQVYPKDLVLNRFKAHLGVFFSSKYKGIVTFHYGVYTPIKDINSTYFEYLFHTEAYKTIYAGLSNGMTVGLQNLSNSAFYGSYVILPPVEEQNAIVDYLNYETRKVNNAIRSAYNQIELLRERRTRLISDVVTGALDVRDVVVPEYVQEQDMEVTEDGDEYEGERAGETDC